MDGRVDSANSLISQQASEILLRVRKDGVISSINQTAESIRIEASKINLVGAVTISDLNSSVSGKLTQINGSGVYTGEISADKINGGTIRGVTIDVSTNAKIGENLILSNSNFGGVQWGTGINPIQIYVDPITSSLKLNAPSVYANGQRLDVAPTAKFG